jgi:hypothetical protein
MLVSMMEEIYYFQERRASAKNQAMLMLGAWKASKNSTGGPEIWTDFGW